SVRCRAPAHTTEMRNSHQPAAARAGGKSVTLGVFQKRNSRRMNNFRQRTVEDGPEAIVQLQRQLDQFRSTQPRRTKLPESLGQAAVELARQYGVYSVANPLR